MSTPSIFISIACFSDPDVIATVHSAFEQAENPDRVFVGVCLQIEPGDERFDALLSLDRVAVDRMDVADARGPILARSRCEALMSGEDYFLQIDCHTRFFPSWDRVVLEEFAKCTALNPKAVISHYPININNMEDEQQLACVGHINRYRHVDTDAIKSHGGLIKLTEQPLPSLGISAAMLFMRGSDREQFPYDPELHFGLHAAEQVLYGIRLWTHGFDIFCPTAHTLGTDYAGSRDRISDNAKRTMNANRSQWPTKTWSKVKFLLDLDSLDQVASEYRDALSKDDFPFGLGQERSVKDYFEFAGIHEQLRALFPYYRERHP